MNLIWHCHACFELKTSLGSVVFDPYSDGSVPGLRLPMLHADAVICSHDHSDHNNASAVRLSGVQPRFAVTQVETFHDGQLGKIRGGNLCTVIDSDSMRIAHLGDLGHTLTPDTAAKLGKVDVLMLPVGGYYTVCAKQAREVALALGAKTIIPMHYSGKRAGLENVAPVDDFLALWSADEIVRLDSNEYDLQPTDSRRIVVFVPDENALI